ncbi:MAG: cyclase family protein [Candidatus Binatia bacterium]
MTSKWLDLSHSFYEGMPYSKLLGPPKIEPVHTLDNHLFQITRYTFLTHLGTHMDAPNHFIRGGKSIDQVSPEQTAGTAVVLNVPKAPCSAITVDDLEKSEPKVQRGDIVFLRTGWGAKYEREDYHDHPYLPGETAKWLVERGAKIVGVDFVTVDLPPKLRKEGFTCPAHTTLLSNDVPIIENLYLEEVVGKKLEVLCFPIKIRGSDGAPTRVMALV